MSGVVYFLLLQDGYVKVGYTSNFEGRMKSYGYHCKEVLGVMQGDRAKERHCHDILDEYRVGPVVPWTSARKEHFKLPDGKLNSLRTYLHKNYPPPPPKERKRRGNLRNEQMNFRCSAEFKKMAREAADRLGCSIPDVMERALQSITQQAA